MKRLVGQRVRYMLPLLILSLVGVILLSGLVGPGTQPSQQPGQEDCVPRPADDMSAAREGLAPEGSDDEDAKIEAGPVPIPEVPNPSDDSFDAATENEVSYCDEVALGAGSVDVVQATTTTARENPDTTDGPRRTSTTSVSSSTTAVESRCVTLAFTSARFLGLTGGDNESELLLLPEELTGQFEIVLTSSDSSHPYQVAQPDERWYVEALDANDSIVFTTEPSDDLPHDVVLNETNVGSYDLDGVVAIRARHAFISSKLNSVTAVSATFYDGDC